MDNTKPTDDMYQKTTVENTPPILTIRINHRDMMLWDRSTRQAFNYLMEKLNIDLSGMDVP